MKALRFIGLASVLLLASITTSYSQTVWRWEEDPTVLNPNISQELGSLPGWLSACGMSDLNGDGRLEYVLVNQTNEAMEFHLAVSEGEFPNLQWSLNAGFFPAFEYERGYFVYSVQFYDLDRDGSLEILLDGGRVLRNRGNYAQPDWERADELFPDVNREDGAPNFCDWDNDGFTDLILGYDNGFFRYEQDSAGVWQDIGFTVCQNVGWGRASHLVDLDSDGDLDVIGLFDMPCMWETTLAILNLGTPEEPEWGEPIDMRYWGFFALAPFDLNGDGFIDLVDGWKYRLHKGESGVAEWDRSVYWGVPRTLLAMEDIDNDRRAEIFTGFGFGPYIPNEWRLQQLESTASGLIDNQIFGEDFADWGSGHYDVNMLEFHDFLGTGSKQMVVGITDNPTIKIGLYEETDDGEGWNWESVEGAFNGLLDWSIACQIPTFGDFDGDGDLDAAVLEGTSYSDEVIVFYTNISNGRALQWEKSAHWDTGLPDTVESASFGAGDFDGDGDCDLVLCQVEYPGSNPGTIQIYANNPVNGVPRWGLALDAFAETGPQEGMRISVADANVDGRPDLILRETWDNVARVFINQSTTAVSQDHSLPSAFSASIAPNPTNGAATVFYETPINGAGSVILYDANGKRIWEKKLGWQTAGAHRVEISTIGLPSGVYQVEVKVGIEQRRLALTILK